MLSFFGKNSIGPADAKVSSGTWLLLICMLSVCLNGLLLVSRLVRGTYDAYIHMFFASHYVHSWFDPWETRWYGGFDLTSYPPLVHQLIALASKPFGLLNAYKFVMLVVFVVLVTGAFRLTKAWADEKAGVFAAFAAVFLTSVAQAAYQWGQLPTIFTSAFLLHGVASMMLWCRHGERKELALGVICLLITLAAHHITIVFCLPLFILGVLIRQWQLYLIHAETGKRQILRLVAFLSVFAVAGAVLFAPFIWYISTNHFTQNPIRHGSRDDLLVNFDALVLFFLIPWGAFAFFVPGAFVDALRLPDRRGLLVTLVILASLGTAGTIPLIKFLLGPMFDVLTLDRFTFWATLAVLPFVGVIIASTTSVSARATLCAMIVLLAGAYMWWLKNYRFQPDQVDMRPIAHYLNQPDRRAYRYLTLGFGSQMSWLSTLSRAPSVDGLYHTVRPDPILRMSGIEAIDGAKYFGETGLGVLGHYLKHNNDYALKYVLNMDPFYDKMLAEAGWQRGAKRFENKVSVWSKPNTVKVVAARANERTHSPGWVQWIRGLYPLLLPLCIIIALLPSRREQET